MLPGSAPEGISNLTQGGLQPIKYSDTRARPPHQLPGIAVSFAESDAGEWAADAVVLRRPIQYGDQDDSRRARQRVPPTVTSGTLPAGIPAEGETGGEVNLRGYCKLANGTRLDIRDTKRLALQYVSIFLPSIAKGLAEGRKIERPDGRGTSGGHTMFQFKARDDLLKGFRTWVRQLLLMPSRSARACNSFIATVYDLLIRVVVLAQETMRSKGAYSSGIRMQDRSRRLSHREASSLATRCAAEPSVSVSLNGSQTVRNDSIAKANAMLEVLGTPQHFFTITQSEDWHAIRHMKMYCSASWLVTQKGGVKARDMITE